MRAGFPAGGPAPPLADRPIATILRGVHLFSGRSPQHFRRKATCAFSSLKTTRRLPNSSSRRSAAEGMSSSKPQPVTKGCRSRNPRSTISPSSTACFPDLDGLSLVKQLRADHNSVPVLFLTNLGGIDDRVEGLESGGDDYLVKPFAVSELLARMNAVARRLPTAQTHLKAGDLEMDLLTRVVTMNGQKIELQPREFKLLECLMRNAGHVVTKTMLLETVWNFHFDPKTNIVETHISRLRAKLGNRGRSGADRDRARIGVCDPCGQISSIRQPCFV